ncbi:MAG: hypothetical protein ABJ242_08670 [Marinomonas sp.]
MNAHAPTIKLWLVGLAMFVIVIAMSPSGSDASQYSIIDHQAAGTAAMVDTIQADWRGAGLRNMAIASMIGDLIFIGFYGWGSVVAGRSFMRAASGNMLRITGVIIAGAGFVFLFTDYVETICQMLQMWPEKGSDPLAATAAFMQPIKSASFVVTFIGVIAALIMHRLLNRGA